VAQQILHLYSVICTSICTGLPLNPWHLTVGIPVTRCDAQHTEHRV